MKTLDAFALINGIDQTLNALKQQSQQISSLEKQINHIISLDGALKGEAGQAIRAFYTECHIPFLQFFQVVIEEYSAALKNTKQALHALESNEHGYISQAFIEHDLDQGLKKAERTISEIVSEVNHAIGRVGHIVHLPNVDESLFQQNYQKAWLETSRTIGLLHAFDREQTSALHETKSSLQTMKQYIDTLSTMFTGPKIDITSYQKGSIFKDGKEEKISSTISGLKDKIDSPKDNPLMIMLKKLKEKQQANVEIVVRNDNHKNISKQVTANDPSLTTLQKEAVNGKNKIHRDIRVINGRLYNVKDIKKLKEFDIADEVVTDPSDIDFIGGRYTVYANKQIIRTYIANGEIRIEEVDKIPESRSRGNAKRILDGEVVSTTENIILEYSGIYDGYRVVTGKDPETSQNISSTDQALSAASIIPITKIVKVGKYVFRLDQGKNVKRVKTPTYGKQSVPKGPYREVNGFPAKVKSGAQEKHIPETPNYKQEVANGKKKSIFYGDNKKAQELLDKYAGKGEFLKNGREVIDFGQKIGKTYDMKTDKYIETTRGTIHYSKYGAHIVPAKPLE
ncbi:T7SS effector LXG polymorphic toxin [Bacillus safensis]|uniref:T7SS effector LXG polymorphic toxin n=1 Tax=Bacillus safensis TaxID=561879 RepID=UPI00228296AF|nr:T7SS effector LXG polymorphic toxin [Bacillus safensis]MCY7508978.1 T7SS effector LXG polymorphic toxin [Bacillus safensis]MCY7514727.1 T7SS effector LXG polymorphic toxin [Bacillus safensis]MED4707671.1 T7SS effector LXG polymorphic toxin [Bacillus safensis]